MWYRIITYLRFLWRSTNQHGIHSPFVFDLVTKCFYSKTKYADYKKLNTYRASLLENNTIIHIHDLGAGSKAMKSTKRMVSSIAKNSGTTHKRAQLLCRLSNYFQVHNVLELGTSLGIGTYALSLGSPKAKITSIEGCSNITAFTKARLIKEGLEKINLLEGDFDQHLPVLLSNKFDIIFFDGNHQKEATINYFKTLLPTTHNNTLFIFDDIYWSRGMTAAWDAIKQHPKITVSIDTYFWGLVFFRKEQQKQHFTIRI